MEENLQSTPEQEAPQTTTIPQPKHTVAGDAAKSKDIVMTSREFEQAKFDQRFLAAVIVGVIVAAVCAVLWAGITLVTGYQIGYMAIAIGLAVGFSIKKAGRGVTPIFGVLGAILAFASCFVGNILMILGFMHTEGYSDYSQLTNLFIASFDPIDVLFYGIALYEGYKFSFRKVTVN